MRACKFQTYFIVHRDGCKSQQFSTFHCAGLNGIINLNPVHSDGFHTFFSSFLWLYLAPDFCSFAYSTCLLYANDRTKQ